MRAVLPLLSMLIITVFTTSPPLLAEELSAQKVFDQLKEFAGTWRGESAAEGREAEAEAEHAGEVVHEFRVSAAGTVVMEMMGPGTDHEMINMYHLDGDDLMLTHYCAAGNQPQMRLDRMQSRPDRLVFDFAGGTNLDPATDNYIHSAEIKIGGDDRLTSAWVAHAGGKQAGVMTFQLARSK